MMQELSLPDLETIALGVFFASTMMAGCTGTWMHWKINSSVSKNDRIPFLSFSWSWEERWEIWRRQWGIPRRYRELFPHSDLPLMHWIFVGLSCAGWLTALLASMQKRV